MNSSNASSAESLVCDHKGTTPSITTQRMQTTHLRDQPHYLGCRGDPFNYGVKPVPGGIWKSPWMPKGLTALPHPCMKSSYRMDDCQESWPPVSISLAALID